METNNNETMVVAYITKNPNSTAEQIATGTAIFKLHVFKVLKRLVETEQIVPSANKPVAYSLVNHNKKTNPDAIRVRKMSQEEKGEAESVLPKPKREGRDTSKLKFLGKEYFKGPLVLAVITHHCKTHKMTVAKLKETFPEELQPRYSTVQLQNMARKLSEGRDRFFLKPDQLIKIGDAKVAVCNQWTSANIVPFLKIAKKLGYAIK
jgi:hypothetical protein